MTPKAKSLVAAFEKFDSAGTTAACKHHVIAVCLSSLVQVDTYLTLFAAFAIGHINFSSNVKL
jgi:hypothetical protein